MYKETRLIGDIILIWRHLSSPGVTGLHEQVLTFPVLLKFGFLMAGALRAADGAEEVPPPLWALVLEDSWSLKAGAFRASPGTPEAWNGMAERVKDKALFKG